MLKVHKTGNKYYNKNNICVARESERTRARNRKRKSKRKEKPFVMNYIIRASALYVQATKGHGYRAWRMRSVKKKVCPCAYNTHKRRVLQAVSTGFMRAFVSKTSVGRKIFISGKENVFNRFCRLRRFAKAPRAHA